MSTMDNPNESPQIIHLSETSSTNHYLRQLTEKKPLPEGSVVVTDFQTAGRGQVGNTWESEAGMNLMFSLVIYPDFLPANRQFLISQIAALSVKDTLSQYTDQVMVKWPNDIYWQDRKICGMLIENDLSGHSLYCSVIGIGINLNQQIFRSDAPNPVSLTQITGMKYDREEVLNRFMQLFFGYYVWLLQEKEEEIRAAYMAALYRNDGFYLYTDTAGAFEARIHSIELTGHLVLQLRNGEQRRYAFKEVSFARV